MTSNRFISEDQMQDALALLERTASAYSSARAKARTGERRAKAVRARIAVHFAKSSKSQAAADAQAESSMDYLNALDDWEKAEQEATELFAQREHAKYVIEVWRSSNANARQGKL